MTVEILPYFQNVKNNTNINCFLFHCLILIIVTLALAVSVVNIIVHGKVELECPARPEQIPDLTEFTNIYVSQLLKRIFSAENRNKANVVISQ